MTNDEKVMLVLLAVAIVGVILFQKKPRPVKFDDPENPVDIVGMSLTPENVSLNRGPAYLFANTPYAGAPPVYNVLPSTSVGMIGQVAAKGISAAMSFFRPNPDKQEEA